MISLRILSAVLVAAATSCNAFVLPTGKTMPSSSNPKINTSRETTTSLEAALLPSIVTKLSPPLRNTIVLSTAASAVAVSIYRSHKKKGLPDANFSEPLPEGNLGCPILGNIDFYTNQGSVETGPGDFFRRQAAKAKNKNIFRYMGFGKPIVMLSGMKNVKSAFNQEFKKIRTTSLMTRLTDLFGGESMLFVNEADRHQYMRRLVGQSMTPDKINLAIPALVASATEQLDQLTMEEPVTMEHVLTNFTLDVAWRQILGLDLKEDEIVQFYEAVDNWIGGIVDLRTLLMPSIKHTKAGKGNAYLVSKIERKMDQLERDGPDGSTMSAMYFARDEEDPSKCLSRDDVISNALLLILAGSETAASTLTVSALALGLHKNVLKKLKDEQLAMIDKHGTEEMTREMIEKDCPYLDAVIKETMRIKPLGTTGAMRVAEETIVVDGTQIPKGNGVVFNIYLTHEGDPVVKEDGNAHMDIVKGFKPERWLDDSTKPTEYMPFGYGPRFCLGYNLAMAEMKVFLALLARRVDFNLVNMNQDNVTWKKSSIIPKPEDGAVVELASLS
mmetsp:Transcript_23489/g.46751  ORF Transcript_23489/g.46751 Transcript_23489/m.46751 type:complete len:557 (-) Transcript_23489:78-1748(-)|eukprot:CAMPEP_0113434994 /NCGR_PEP_ID=MMETSP0013_2-20120614/35994_1 /TAXON_ID=2843 ORGANISM="Skeletonema costatum, Strain 1716" /NCGR_SAMPLE_ID=MMETSP0013_2 /ASSEMBLY_ACC=CAM_ASM_000158 /LENGTH=556 /DNA_ID=CAMNT_0000325249 /DNA_START=11 /DNA_END=1681 /DNA_ORIENTATION=- /assembly_acc=CAM_ASM_000158